MKAWALFQTFKSVIPASTSISVIMRKQSWELFSVWENFLQIVGDFRIYNKKFRHQKGCFLCEKYSLFYEKYLKKEEVSSLMWECWHVWHSPDPSKALKADTSTTWSLLTVKSIFCIIKAMLFYSVWNLMVAICF